MCSSYVTCIIHFKTAPRVTPKTAPRLYVCVLFCQSYYSRSCFSSFYEGQFDDALSSQSVPLLQAVINTQYAYRQGLVAARMRAALTTCVFRAVLKLSTAVMSEIGSGAETMVNTRMECPGLLPN